MSVLKKIIVVCLVVASVSFGIGAYIFYESGFSISEFEKNVRTIIEQGNIPWLGRDIISTDFSKTYEFPLTDVDRIRVDTTIGDVTVKPSDAAVLVVNINGQVSEGLKGEPYNAYVEGKTIVIEVLKDVNFSGILSRNEARIEILLPKDYGKNMEIHTVSGEIGSSGANLNELRAQSVSGRIDAGDSSAAFLRAETVSGTISGAGKYSSVIASTTSGEITVSGISGPTTAKSVSGKIVLSMDVIRGDNRMETVSGDIEVRVTGQNNFSYALSTVSGSLSVVKAGVETKGERNLEQIIPALNEMYRLSTVSGDISLAQQ